MKLTSGTRYLVDTNILVYSVNRESSHYPSARKLLEDGFERGALFVVAHQNLIEFIAVLTRGYSIKLKEALSDAGSFTSRFEVIAPLPTTFERYTQLAQKVKETLYPFDLYLAATMLDNDVERIITANAKDFQGVGLKEILVP
jgi:predicted nucleic acid-binding protein